MAGPSLFCPSSAELHVERLAIEGALLTVTAVARREAVACPACGASATRVHSRYTRTLADLPWQGTQVRLVVTVRRFFCATTGCVRRIFAEPFPETAARYARRTARATTTLEAIGFALGGRPGARLARALGLASAPGTVLTRVTRAAVPEALTPRVLGVDDFAFRRGQRYGTVLVDLERRRVIDLLPDREAATLATWLRAHPGVAIISRDRGGAYAEGARQGAPDAQQIADRFHLVHNLVEALENACTRHHAALRTAAQAGVDASGTAGPSGPTVADPLSAGAAAREEGSRASGGDRPRLSTDERQQQARRARRLAPYEEVGALHRAGHSKQQIARTLSLARGTVGRWLAAGQCPERATPTQRRTRLVDPYAREIAVYYDSGGTDARELLARLTALGFRGTHVTVWRALHARRVARPAAAVLARPPTPPAPPAVRVPTPRQTAWLLRTPAADLTDEPRASGTALTAACPALADAQRLGEEFVRLLREHDLDGFDAWLLEAEVSELRSFARGLRRDGAAVRAAITSPWSNGQVEGQVHRLKVIKKSFFGRAGLPLLRARMLQGR